MKRVCKSLIFIISILSFQYQLYGMASRNTLWDSMSSQEKSVKNQYIAQCCDTCERYMKIDFFEKQFIKDFLSMIHAEIDGLELQKMYLEQDKHIPSADRDLRLKSIDQKIILKHRECDRLWQVHERYQMNLLTFNELSDLQEFIRERDSSKSAPDVNQQIFAHIDPSHCVHSPLERQLLEELHAFALNDQMWLQHMAHISSNRIEKKRSDVWRYIQHPKQLILGKIFSAAVDGCPVAQAFVRHYHFDFVLSNEPISCTSILPLQLFSAPELSQSAPSTSSSTDASLTKNKSKLNPEAPAFLPSFIRLSLESKKTESDVLAHTEVVERQDLPVQQDLPRTSVVATPSLNPSDKHPAVKKHDPILQSTSRDLELSSVTLHSDPEKPIAAPEVLAPAILAAQQPQEQTQATHFVQMSRKKQHAKEYKRKKRKQPEVQESATKEPIRQEPVARQESEIRQVPVKTVEQRKEAVQSAAQSSSQPAPQVSKQEVHEQPVQVDNNALIKRFYNEGMHDQAITFIEKLGNKHLISWYRGVCLLQRQGREDIKNAIDLLEPLFSLIPGRKYLDRRELVGFDDAVRVLSQNLDNRYVKAFLIRLLISAGTCPRKALIQSFVREASSISDASIQFLIFYIYDKGLIPQSESSMQFVYHLITALDNPSLRQNIREEVIYFLHKIGQPLFDVNFQAKLHDQASYPHDDINTRCAISACYALVPVLLNSDPLEAACMFIAAENTVAFLCKILQAEGRDGAAEALAYLPAGAIALNALQKFINQQRNIDVLSALIFSYSRRYLSVICHSDLSVDLAAISRQFLADSKQYFSSADHTNQHRLLLLSIASNAYSMLGCKLGIKRDILIELMRGVVAVSPEQYWFFRYNLESLIAGSQDEHVTALNSYRSRIAFARKDALISSMIISGLKKESSWWCTIL